MKKKIIVKTVLFIIFVLIIQILFSSIVPIYSNNIAMEQMKDSYTSSSFMRVYQVLSDYRVVLYLAVGLLTYRKDIFKIKKEKSEDEEK